MSGYQTLSLEMLVQPGWIRGSEKQDCGDRAGEVSALLVRVPGYLVALGYCAGHPTLAREELFVFLL